MDHQASPVFPNVGHPHFVVGMDDEGHWIARDRSGLIGGIFISREAAIEFAEFEAEHDPNAIVVLPESIHLSLVIWN